MNWRIHSGSREPRIHEKPIQSSLIDTPALAYRCGGSPGIKEPLNKSSAERVVANRDAHKTHDEGRSFIYDAKECNAVSARFCRNPKGRWFYGRSALSGS